MAERVPLYRQVATMRVNTNRRNPGAVVRYLAARLENPGTGQPGADAVRRGDCRRRRRHRAHPTSRTPSAAAAPTPATPAALAARRAEARK